MCCKAQIYRAVERISLILFFFGICYCQEKVLMKEKNNKITRKIKKKDT